MEVPVQRILEHYDEHASTNHLDVSAGPCRLDELGDDGYLPEAEGDSEQTWIELRAGEGAGRATAGLDRGGGAAIPVHLMRAE